MSWEGPVVVVERVAPSRQRARIKMHHPSVRYAMSANYMWMLTLAFLFL